jgi:hypothetical protein
VQKLPKAKSVGKQEMSAFLAQAEDLNQKLALYKQAYLLAVTEGTQQSRTTH